MSAPPAERALYVDARPDPVFSVLHPSAPGAERDTAVLICPPFGWEDVASYRSRRAWARELAADGYATLRFDLPGSGDSGGSPRDDDRLGAWIAAVTAAAQTLRVASGAQHIAVVGLGLGGMVALAALAAGAPIGDLALWGVPARGRTLVRELHAFSRLEDSKLADAGAEVPAAAAPADAGTLHAGGHAMTEDTVAGLQALDLTTIAVAGVAAHRVLLLERDGRPPDARLVEHLEASGARVAVAPGPGFGAMMSEPRLSEPPTEVFATVTAWLAESAAPAAAPPAPPRLMAVAAVPAGGATVRETAMDAEADGVRLPGILTEPAGATSGDVAVVWLNAGAIRRSGPNRMWTEAARRWAARGVPSLRFDLEGIGDADGDVDWGEDQGGFYLPAYSGQVRAALDALEARGVARRFVLAGLCSGAYWALHEGADDPRVSGVIAINPRTLAWDPGLGTAREARALRRLVRPETWRKVADGRIAPRRALEVSRAALSRVAELRAHASRGTDGDPVADLLDRLEHGGTRVLFLFSGEELLREELARDGRLARITSSPGFAVDVLAERGDLHTLRPPALQARAGALVDAAIEREL